MSKRPFVLRLYFEPALYETAWLIGYEGIAIAEFWEKAKRLQLPVNDVRNAVYDLTRADKREGAEPRYELNGDARKLCWGILGPPPEHPLRDYVLHGPGGLVGDEIGKWQEEHRRRKAEEQVKPDQNRGRKGKRR